MFSSSQVYCELHCASILYPVFPILHWSSFFAAAFLTSSEKFFTTSLLISICFSTVFLQVYWTLPASSVKTFEEFTIVVSHDLYRSCVSFAVLS
jgi:hypothetical protein